MVENYKDIQLRPEVMNMDGWGYRKKKISTYEYSSIHKPLKWTGFKIFYKNDIKTESVEMQPKEVLKLVPAPVYIQYQ